MSMAGQLIAGVDEAGRGPLAGPVFAAAVILDPGKPINGLDDSKKITARRRESVAREIQTRSLAFSIARAEVEEIDQLNILQATLLAMQRAITCLALQPTQVWIDGNQCPILAVPVVTVVKGDALVPAISAASILAKVARDNEMVALDRCYPGYGLAQHKGYPSRQHLEALERLGATPIHRKSYAPVRRLLGASS